MGDKLPKKRAQSIRDLEDSAGAASAELSRQVGRLRIQMRCLNHGHTLKDEDPRATVDVDGDIKIVLKCNRCGATKTDFFFPPRRFKKEILKFIQKGIQ